MGGGLADGGAQLDGGQPPDACLTPPTLGPCNAAFPRYTYLPALDRCELTIWGGCGPETNLFGSLGDCTATCSTPKTRCLDQSRTPLIVQWAQDGCSVPGGWIPTCRVELQFSPNPAFSQETCDRVELLLWDSNREARIMGSAVLSPAGHHTLRQVTADFVLAYPPTEPLQLPGSSVATWVIVQDEMGPVQHVYSSPPDPAVRMDRFMTELVQAMSRCDDSPWTEEFLGCL